MILEYAPATRPQGVTQLMAVGETPSERLPYKQAAVIGGAAYLSARVLGLKRLAPWAAIGVFVLALKNPKLAALLALPGPP